MVATRAYRRTPTATRGKTASKHTDESEDVRAAHHAAVAPERSTPMQLLALQRTMGNGAATIAVQRLGKGKKAQDPFELGSGIAEQSGGVVTSVGTGLDPKTYQVSAPPKLGTENGPGGFDKSTGMPKGPDPGPDLNDPSVQMGFAGGSLGATQGLVGSIGSGIAWNTARVERNKARQHGHLAGVRLHERQMRMAGGDFGKNVTTLGSGVTDLTQKGLAITSQGSTQLANASVAAGAFAAPLALFNMLRDLRKTAKAWMRCARLETQFQNWDEPRATIEALQEQFDEAESGRVEAEGKHAEAKTAKAKYEGLALQDRNSYLDINRQIGQLQRAPAQAPGFVGKVKGVGSAISRNAEIAALKIKLAIVEKQLEHHQAQVAEQTQRMTELEAEVRLAVQTKDTCITRIETAKPLYEKMKATVGATGERAQKESIKQAKGAGNVSEPSLMEISAYAYGKNHHGRIKKLISTIGGALATGGAAASLAVAIAAMVGTASAVAMATPVGWALAGAAAAIGIGLGLYKGFKWLVKRWGMARTDRTGAQRGFGARLGKTLAVWTPAGVSRREKYAKRLLEMSLGDKVYTEQMDEARKLIANLVGHDWSKLGLSSLVVSGVQPMNLAPPTAFAGGGGTAGSSTGIDSGASAHQGIDTDELGGPKRGATWTLAATAKTNRNFKAAHELLIAKFAS